jgi:hypothetical protein
VAISKIAPRGNHARSQNRGHCTITPSRTLPVVIDGLTLSWSRPRCKTGHRSRGIAPLQPLPPKPITSPKLPVMVTGLRVLWSRASVLKRARGVPNLGPFHHLQPAALSRPECQTLPPPQRSTLSALSLTTYFFTEISFPAMIASSSTAARKTNHQILSSWLKRATRGLRGLIFQRRPGLDIFTAKDRG